ncbi:MAG: urea carboxylase [Gammaproteobacteria bacterium]
MFDKVLIANRGAIACRVMRTLRRLGVRAVAVYTRADVESLHVRMADERVLVGDGPAASSYLDADRILQAARATGARAIHPGYGFLSENALFARRCETEGIAFVGPTAEQMRSFGLKHVARELAARCGVPLLPGSDLLADVTAAASAAERIGYPVMLKSTAGGGGIGMQRCHDESDLRAAFASVERLARNNFADAGIFLEKYVERARHVEVQVFGDGRGTVIDLGARDCSVQRRNQKVIEETPPPNIPAETVARLCATATALAASVQYRSAGTVEFVYDDERGEFYFLEVNTRLQVEHGVTEQVWDVDLVEWMLRIAAGETLPLASLRAGLSPRGHAVQARLYAEDPAHGFRPSTGLLTRVTFPQAPALRVDAWVETGVNVPPFYDPMLAKLIAHGADRDAALAGLAGALEGTRIDGVETNREYLSCILDHAAMRAGRPWTRMLEDLPAPVDGIEVVEPGTMTTVQDHPGRTGYWAVGVPPSGPADAFSFRIANAVVGNPADAAGLEITVSGPRLRFHRDAIVALAGAPMPAELDGQPAPFWEPVAVRAGSELKIGSLRGTGVRAYLAIGGGIDVPPYLGSRSTFTLGGFGGHGGRALRPGDRLRIGAAPAGTAAPWPARAVPHIDRHWTLRVVYGPHGAPDYFTGADIDAFFAATWEVHYNSNRTGIRLIGPRPQWAREDGGEAGLHPSNIHDNAYAIGAVDFTGDMPVVLGPDGPSLGGFVCPATVIEADRWQLGQMNAGDRVRFVPVTHAGARALAEAREDLLARCEPTPVRAPRAAPRSAILRTTQDRSGNPLVRYRPAGDDYLLVEFGPPVLDIALRARAHAWMGWFERLEAPGIVDLTPGIRSLQIHYDPRRLPRAELMRLARRAERDLADIDDLRVPSRIVHLPLSWDDPATRLAIEKYTQSVRPDAPWCPSNIEFIRRINGLPDIESVRRTVFDASYLVLGLGDVYLGAPVATPLDPRHRLVTTKYNPARTWTPENAVGIGGAYLCIYGMEGPGGYQFVGRTLQMWNRFRQTREFAGGRPWLLRFFDQIRFHPVSADELLDIRAEFPLGRYPLKIEEAGFSLREYRAFLAANAGSIDAFRATQQAAFRAERERWIEQGQAVFHGTDDAGVVQEQSALPPDGAEVTSPVAGSVWQLSVTVGERVRAGQQIAVVESMKMEIAVQATADGVVLELPCAVGAQVHPGRRLAVIAPP